MAIGAQFAASEVLVVVHSAVESGRDSSAVGVRGQIPKVVQAPDLTAHAELRISVIAAVIEFCKSAAERKLLVGSDAPAILSVSFRCSGSRRLNEPVHAEHLSARSRHGLAGNSQVAVAYFATLIGPNAANPTYQHRCPQR